MFVLAYPNCSTCKKAMKWLDSKNAVYHVRHIKENRPTYEELKAWYEKSGLPLKQFFNTSGVIYKEMGLKDKLASMTEEEQLRLLATDGMLVRRPVLVSYKGVCPGFKEAVWEKLL